MTFEKVVLDSIHEMDHRLNELASLAKRLSAKFTLTIDGDTIRATFAVPGTAKETVAEWDPSTCGPNHSRVDAILHKMLERLGYRDLPTTGRFFDLLNPAQFARVLALHQEYQDIKNTVLHPARAERVLDAPRSSLQPAILQGEADYQRDDE